MSSEIISKLSVGDKVGRLTIIEIIPNYYSPKGKRIPRNVSCLCDCGTECMKRYSDVRREYTRSCGCFRKETWEGHGGSNTSEYKTWCNMKTRCLNEKSQDYYLYGGRGIEICERWKTSFQNFINDMGKKPTKIHSIDRIDNNGNYEPSNCRWATPSEQALNKREYRFAATKKCITCGVHYVVSPSKINISKYCSWRCRTGKDFPKR